MTEIRAFRIRSCILAQELSKSDDLFVEKALELWFLGNKIYTEAWNTEFHVFGVIASETEHIPVGIVREKCSERFLRRADEEVVEIISFHEKDLKESYNEILRVHGEA